jgi:hypothetical protein
MADIDYSSYINYIESICDSKNLDDFKTHPSYTWVLEHVSSFQGSEYLQHIRQKTSLTEDQIREYCTLNDSVGQPKKTNYGFMEASPTSLRYILHAHLILTHLKSLQLPSVDIVEIGGGYGGLALAVHFYAKLYNMSINSYTIVDFSSITRLQNLYISSVMPSINLTTIDATTFGSTITKENMFLISNYCFSEISREFQNTYRTTLFPKVSHGFMAWNMIPLYNFGFSMRDEEEYPKTGSYNRYVYF